MILPRDISPLDRRRIVRLCAGLEKINLKENEILWEVELSGFDRRRVALNPLTWTKASETWASITPVLLDQFPKKRRPVEEIIIRLACERIGLPAPVQVEHGVYCVSPAPAFRIRRKKDEKPAVGSPPEIAVRDACSRPNAHQRRPVLWTRTTETLAMGGIAE